MIHPARLIGGISGARRVVATKLIALNCISDSYIAICGLDFLAEQKRVTLRRER